MLVLTTLHPHDMLASVVGTPGDGVALVQNKEHRSRLAAGARPALTGVQRGHSHGARGYAGSRGLPWEQPETLPTPMERGRFSLQR
jgi:hypothetical protein